MSLFDNNFSQIMQFFCDKNIHFWQISEKFAASFDMIVMGWRLKTSNKCEWKCLPLRIISGIFGAVKFLVNIAEWIMFVAVANTKHPN